MSFKQFQHFEHVEANDPNLEQIIESNLNEGKKTVVYVSMCKSDKRDTRLEYFKSLDCTKGWIIEEADYGVWTEGQAKPLINASKGDFTIVTTGTNMDRATENWEIDKILTVDYLELLVNKRAAEKELEKVQMIFDFKRDNTASITVITEEKTESKNVFLWKLNNEGLLFLDSINEDTEIEFGDTAYWVFEDNKLIPYDKKDKINSGMLMVKVN